MDALNSYTRKVHIKMTKSTRPQPENRSYHYHSRRPKKAGWIPFTITIDYMVEPMEAHEVYESLWAPGAVIPPFFITEIHGEITDYSGGEIDALYIIQGSMARPSIDAPRPGRPDVGYPYAKFTPREHFRHCPYCYKMDHTRRACPRSHCHKCREEGHWPPDCPNKQKMSNRHRYEEIEGPMDSETDRSRKSCKAKGKSNRSRQSQATAQRPASSCFFIGSTWASSRRRNPKRAASASSVSGRKHEV